MSKHDHQILLFLDRITRRPFRAIYLIKTLLQDLILFPFALQAWRTIPFHQLPPRYRFALARVKGGAIYETHWNRTLS